MKDHYLKYFLLIAMGALFGLVATPTVLAQDKGNGIVDRTDPGYPEPMIGKRNFTLDLDRITEDGLVTQVVLHHSKFSSDLESARFDFPIAFRARQSIEATTSREGFGGDLIRAKARLPWEKPSDREIEDNGPTDAYPAGSTVYYRWGITREKAIGEVSQSYSLVHSFTMPRRITLAILGDSYGSGEGAPDKGSPSPWIQSIDGRKAHRSPISGQELAVKEFFHSKPNFAYDYVNVSCTGAELRDITHRTDTYVDYVQHEELSRWLKARNYSELDTIILSISGNDFGFADLIKGYIGASPQRLQDLKNWAGQWVKCRLIEVAHTTAQLAAPAVAALACSYLAWWPPAYALHVITAYGLELWAISETLGDAMVECWEREDELLATLMASFTFFNRYGEDDAHFSHYAGLVKDRHERMARVLSMELRNDSPDALWFERTVRPAQVIQTNYPSFLKGAHIYTEQLTALNILRLWADDPDWNLDYTVDVTIFGYRIHFTLNFNNILSLLDAPISWVQNISDLGLVDADEVDEVNESLAPPFWRNGPVPKPAGGGINHHVQEAVNRADDRWVNTDWCYVELDEFLPWDAHLASSNRHFVRLSDASNLEGPHLYSNAFHPNDIGHSQIYRPAILEALEGKLTGEYFKEAAAKGGLVVTILPFFDLGFLDDLLPGTVYDPVRGFVSVTGTVTNRGNIKADVVSVIRPKLYIPPALDLPEIILKPTVPIPPIPPLEPGESFNYEGTYAIDPVPLRKTLPFQVSTDEPDGFDEFTSRDAALRYFFSGQRVTFGLEISNEEGAQELNAPNNLTTMPLVIFPDLEQNDLAESIATVKAELSSVVGKPIENVDYQLLVSEKSVREYFGFYSHELDEVKMSVEQAIAGAQAEAFVRINDSLNGENPPPPKTHAARDGKRPIYLFTGEDSPFASGNDTRVRGPDGRFRSFSQVVESAPRDGRMVSLGLPIGPNLLQGLDLKDEVVFRAGRPAAWRGLSMPGHRETLTGKEALFKLGGTNEGNINFLKVGSQIGSDDYLYDYPLGGPNEASISVSGLPHDGRKVYATLKILNKKGYHEELYEYETQQRNATLTSPLPNECLGNQSRTISWSEPDLGIGGSVEAYRLAIGTIPYTGDIVPGASALPVMADGTVEGFGYTMFEAGSDAHSNRSIDLPRGIVLPQDGRTLYITLGTLRDGEWEYELFKRGCLERSAAGLVLPEFDDLIGSAFRCKVSTGSSEEDTYRLGVGTSPGSGDLFDSGIMPGDEALHGFEVVMPTLRPALDSHGRPVPVWVTLAALNEQGQEVSLQSYPLMTDPQATIHTPGIAERLKLEGKVNFSWNPGYDARGYRLAAYVSGDSGLTKLHEVELGANELTASLDFSGIDIPRYVVIVLETQRSAASEIISGAKQYRYHVDTSDLHFYGQDEIPDHWQFSYFGRANSDGLADADPDRDGTSNLMEYLSRSDPNDPGDRFEPSLVYKNNGRDFGIDSFVIEAPVYSTSYQLQSSVDLTEWSNVGLPVNPLPGGSTLEFDVGDEPASKVFYRFVLQEN